MNNLLLAVAAALTLSSTHAVAEHPVGTGIPNAKTFDQQTRHGGAMSLRGRRRSESEVAWSGYSLQSSYDDRDWSAESGNDWWNDRPDRAFPRWVRHNQNCTPDRIWWSGSGWHC